ncbi:MAG: hypothetical protein IJI05_03755 [Erysipelotrichaceae bacterium]|nr:hypothetical protein [Erysipelotrichaceae bacterium]
MKEINTKGIPYIEPVDGTAEWYFAESWPQGDLYEAEEMARSDEKIEGTTLLLIRYPEGKVYQPVEKTEGLYLGRPLYYEGCIAFLGVNFESRDVIIYSFDCENLTIEDKVHLPLEEIRDCYNLMLHRAPLTLSRQGADKTFDIIWPEKLSIQLGNSESFFHRDGDRLFFNVWFEDPKYREETYIRDIHTGELVEKRQGAVSIMPNGELWHIR